MIPVLLSWSGGKDSAMALECLMEHPSSYQVIALITTINRATDSIPIHEVPRYLVENQARSLGLRLKKVLIPPDPTNQEYEERLTKLLLSYQKRNVKTIAFGDLFLEDIREYRERYLQSIGFEGIFPLWKINTQKLAETFLERGYKAIVTTVDLTKLDSHFTGQLFTWDFLDQLPNDVDPCGENGEFHTFVFDGPLFKKPVPFKVKKKVILKDRFATSLLR